jgi:hypothetical protein
MAPLLQRPAYPWRADEATQKPAASSRRVHGRKVRCYARDRDRDREQSTSTSKAPRLQDSQRRSRSARTCRGVHVRGQARDTQAILPSRSRSRPRPPPSRAPAGRSGPPGKQWLARAGGGTGRRQRRVSFHGRDARNSDGGAGRGAGQSRKAEPGAAARTPLLLASGSGSGGSRATRHIIHTDGSVPIQI